MSPPSSAPGLYVVATPIGNLGDLSPRAADILAGAALVAAEDTRTVATLFRHMGRPSRTVSLTEHNVQERIPSLLATARDAVVALISEAGTPSISDPGARLVDAAHHEGIPVYAVPGPSALAAALSVAGFHLNAGQPMVFLGFLPRTRSERTRAIERTGGLGGLLVFFESPRRLARTLTEVAALLGDPEVAVCREMTKVHEEVVRGRASALASRFTATRGECTVVVDARRVTAGTDIPWQEAVAAMRRAGAQRSPAAAEVSRLFRISRESAYRAWDEVGPN